MRRRLRNAERSGTAKDWLSLFYDRSSVGGDLMNYYYYRFGQPRHLAALCLASVLPRVERPVLDLACGCGHLSHFLSNCSKGHRIIGVDRGFHQLWLAKEVIAPKGEYVCADVDDGLPFADQSFDGVICSDAFHYFRDKRACLHEMGRCAPGSVQILTRVGNVLIEPQEGWELSPDGYGLLFGGQELRAFDEDVLVDRYLLGLGPELSSPPPLASLDQAKWLSFVLSPAGEMLEDPGRFGEWPHAVGRLGLNPIFTEQSVSTGDETHLQFRFPSAWFEFENRRMSEYHRDSIAVGKEVLRQVAEGTRSDEVEELLAGFGVLGFPDGYL